MFQNFFKLHIERIRFALLRVEIELFLSTNY